MLQKMLLGVSQFVLTIFIVSLSINAPLSAEQVAALGRIEPEKGIIVVGVASTPLSTAGSVIAKLHVMQGDKVQSGQLLAETDSAAVAKAMVFEAEKSLAHSKKQFEAHKSAAQALCIRAQTAKSESQRREQLRAKGLAAAEEAELSQGIAIATNATCNAERVAVSASKMAIDLAKATLDRRRAEYQRQLIYSPVDALVLEVNAQQGEFVTSEGVLELAAVQKMFAVAEVYETDISRVSVGQRAEVSSDAFSEVLSGKVVYINSKVQKHDAIGTDPAARQDARIIEVDILLDKPDVVRALTNLQVDILIK